MSADRLSRFERRLIDTLLDDDPSGRTAPEQQRRRRSYLAPLLKRYRRYLVDRLQESLDRNDPRPAQPKSRR